MGCLGYFGMGPVRGNSPSPEMEKNLTKLEKKMEDYKETFEENVQKAQKARNDQLEKRRNRLLELKQKNEEITEEEIKKLNKDELDVEIKFLENAAEKIHFIFNTGIDLVEPVKKVTLDELEEKAKSAPAVAAEKINKQIEEVKNLPAVDFLNSTFGKILKDALEKKGMSEAFLKETRQKIFEERQERRKLEREEFGIKVNEFEDEKIDDIKLDLSSLIMGEKNGDFEREFYKNFKDFVKEKQLENK